MISFIIEFIVAFVVYLIVIGSIFRPDDIDQFDDIVLLVIMIVGLGVSSYGFDAILYMIAFRLGLIIIRLLISLLSSAIKFFKKTTGKDK